MHNCDLQVKVGLVVHDARVQYIHANTCGQWVLQPKLYQFVNLFSMDSGYCCRTHCSRRTSLLSAQFICQAWEFPAHFFSDRKRKKRVPDFRKEETKMKDYTRIAACSVHIPANKIYASYKRIATTNSKYQCPCIFITLPCSPNDCVENNGL